MKTALKEKRIKDGRILIKILKTLSGADDIKWRAAVDAIPTKIYTSPQAYKEPQEGG